MLESSYFRFTNPSISQGKASKTPTASLWRLHSSGEKSIDRHLFGRHQKELPASSFELCYKEKKICVEASFGLHETVERYQQGRNF
jgi:hypothetical protein